MQREEFKLRVPIFDPMLLGGILLISVFLAAMYLFVGRGKPGAVFILLPIPVCIVGAIAFILYYRIAPPTVVVDHAGIEDSRIGCGKIRWTDITGIETLSLQGTPDSGIGIRVRDPRSYLWRITNPFKRIKAGLISRETDGRLYIHFYGFENDVYAFESMLKQRLELVRSRDI